LNVDSKGAFLQLQEGVPIPLSNLASGVGSQDVIVSIRPEEMEISTETQSGIDGVVENYQFLGLNTIYFIRMFGNRRLEIVQESTIDNIIQPGTKVSLHLKSEKINVFNTDGSVNLLSGVNNDLHIEDTHVS
jgi:iron(III) transport system ATP-binding protein